MVFQFGIMPDALAIEIELSITPERQIKKLEHIGFDCNAAVPSRSNPVECRRKSQLVALNGPKIMLLCLQKRACWSEPLELLASLGNSEQLSPILPVIIYEAGGSSRLFCRTQVGDRQRQVCIRGWSKPFVDRNIRTTVWNLAAKEVLSPNLTD